MDNKQAHINFLKGELELSDKVQDEQAKLIRKLEAQLHLTRLFLGTMILGVLIYGVFA